MRLTLAVPLIVACGLALPAMAQPTGQSAADHAKQASATAPPPQAATPAPAQAKPENPEAAAALVIAIRQREAQERLAQMACNAGDASKCQPANAPTTPKTPSP